MKCPNGHPVRKDPEMWGWYFCDVCVGSYGSGVKVSKSGMWYAPEVVGDDAE